MVCVGLRRIVTVAFLRRVQVFLLTYLQCSAVSMTMKAQSICSKITYFTMFWQACLWKSIRMIKS